MPKFQAVILAGGPGDRLYPLCEHSSKALLPVKNRPLLYYQLTSLQEASFTSCFVVVNKSSRAAVEDYCNHHHEKINPALEIKVRQVADETDTADAIRVVAEEITMDFIVIACDTVTNVSLWDVLETHQRNEATCTMVVKQRKDRKLEGAFKHEKMPTDYVGLNTSGRVLYMECSSNMDSQNIVFTQKYLQQRGHFTLTTTLMDVHIYVFAKWIPDFLTKKEGIGSLKSELLPLLTHQQLQKEDSTTKMWGALRYVIPTNENSLVNWSNLPEKINEAREEFQYQLDALMCQDSKKTDKIRCFAHHVECQPGQYLIRANYPSTYNEINRELLKKEGTEPLKMDLPPKVQIGADCAIGRDLSVKESVTIKSSILAPSCKIGTGVRITNSILMAGTIVGDGTTVANCIISSSLAKPTKIGNNCKVKDCQVEGGYEMEDGDEAKEEALTRDDAWDEPNGNYDGEESEENF